MKKIIALFLSLMLILPLCSVFTVSAASSSVIYIDDLNAVSTTQTGPVLLYGEGKTASDFNMGNYDWWDKIVVKFDPTSGAFLVVASYPAVGGNFDYASYTLGADEVMLITFEWDGYGFGGTIETMAIGDKVYLYNFDFTNSSSVDQLSGSTSGVYFTTYEPSMGNGYYGYVPLPESNIKSLGAKINTGLVGIRFGTSFKNDPMLGEVVALGTLLIPEAKLGDSELSLDAENDYVLDVPARTIALEDYVPGKPFEDYDSFTFYVTLIGLEGHENENIVARSYAIYKANTGVSTVYADTITRNYADVLDAILNPPVTPPETDDEEEEIDDTLVYAPLTYANWWDWSDSLTHQNNILVFASANSAKTAAALCEQSVGFLGDLNGVVLEYNESKGTWVVTVSDFIDDGVNAAEGVTLGANKMVVIFHKEAVIGQKDAYNFLISKATVGQEFVLTGAFSAIQAVQGKISNVYLSLASANWTPPVEEIIRPSDTSVGTVQSTVATYTSSSSPTASSGDTDGLSCVLYAPQNNTIGISTFVNLSAIDTTLYTSTDALNKQNICCGLATDKTVDNAYLYLCLNSTNWSGDFGLIKRLGDNDWEIITSETLNNVWYWNAYAYVSSVSVYYNPDYVYSKWNVMDGQNVLYIKNSSNVKDLQMNLMYSGGKLTYSLLIGGVTIFSVSDTGTISNARFGRAASITNSGTASGATSANYLNLISSTKNGRAPATLTNVQFYNTYYYTSSGSNKLTVSSGSLWIYPNKSSSAGYLTNTNGNPIVSCKEVTLTSGVTMDIINIENY